MWLKLGQVGMPSRKQLAVIWQTVILAKEDSNPSFILANKQIRRYQDKLYLLPHFQNLQSVSLAWNLSSPLNLPDNLGQLSISFQNGECRLPNDDEQVSVRFIAQGSFHIVGRNGSRQIKKLWQEFNIPPWMRTRIPLIYYNENLITAVGVFVTEFGKGQQIKFIYH